MSWVLFRKIDFSWFQILLSEKNPRKKKQILNISDRSFYPIVVCHYPFLFLCFCLFPWFGSRVSMFHPPFVQKYPESLGHPHLVCFLSIFLSDVYYWWMDIEHAHTLLCCCSFYLVGLKGASEPKSGRRYSTGALSGLKPASDSVTLKSNGSSRIGNCFGTKVF